jgi:branched-chain amino acid transport system permease protein
MTPQGKLSLTTPGRRQALLATVLIGLALVLLPFAAAEFGNAWVRILAFALLYVMLALGLNIVVGYAGLLDLGYVAFYAVGAYLYALLASPHLAENFEWIAQTFPDGLHSSIWFVIPLSALVAAGFGVLLGFPVLRLRGDYLAIVTLGFGEIIRIFMNNLNAPANITNGPQGITNIDPISIAGVSLAQPLQIGGLSLPSVHLYYYLFLVLTLLVVLVSVRLNPHGWVGPGWPYVRMKSLPRPWASIPATSSCWPLLLVRASAVCQVRCSRPFRGLYPPRVLCSWRAL